MKRAFALFAAASFVLVGLPMLATYLSAAGSETQKAITDLEYKWADAQKADNAKVVAPMLAEGFVNTDADGQTYGQERLLANL